MEPVEVEEASRDVAVLSKSVARAVEEEEVG
jgi:hypothetical protein